MRPCFLVVDREFAGSISTRKLVLETAKFNVITAYSYDEALATLARYPLLDGVIATGDRSGETGAFLQAVRSRYPDMKRVLTGEAPEGDVADVYVESFAPDKLLAAVRSLFPGQSAALYHKERELENAADQA